jgi:hypothetical protein
MEFDERGWECRLSSHVVKTVNSDWDLGYFCNRHVRWSQIRRELAPPAFFMEQLINPVVWIIAAVVAGAPTMMVTPSLFGVALGGVFLKAFSDDMLNRRVRGKSIGLRGYLATPFKDLLVLVLWAIGSVRKTVNWRGNRFVLGEGSKLLPAERPLHEVASVTAVEDS